ncbi:hypothetical protein BV898_18902 [Hypsibius exemplaris]|uniref:Secreted protein n=1 Tax=Hypsibius exemplaris TaxID=2072580 RepID=A0A9X6RNZ5_HYPEX|nr:hypothetical protein BV898_18902 [Hypsibius exemplaris]
MVNSSALCVLFMASVCLFSGTNSDNPASASASELSNNGSPAKLTGLSARLAIVPNPFTIPPQGSPHLAAALLDWRTAEVLRTGSSASGGLLD